MKADKISIAVDPGKTGALLALSGDDRRILFATKFTDGVPSDDFQIRYIPGPPFDYRFTVISKIYGSDFPVFHSNAEILVTLETHDWRHASMRRANIKPNFAAKHEFYTGRIYQWLTERGFGELIKKVEPQEWQELLKGCPGDTPKERAEFWVKEVSDDYCEYRKNRPDSSKDCKTCGRICPLKQYKIIGPKGGVDKDRVDALCIANWRLDIERVKE